MQITLDPNNVDDYRKFLKIKELPRFSFVGRTAIFPDHYADRLGIKVKRAKVKPYKPLAGMFDYQEAIARMAIERRKFAIFADCGLGKTLIMLEFARHAAENLPPDHAALMVSPLMVCEQTMAEAKRFYGDSIAIEQVPANRLAAWTQNPTSRIGMTNYEALTDEVEQGKLGGLVLDESSMLKSHYGKWGTKCIELGKGLEWKLAGTGTPAPNDRIEYANHAVLMDAFPTVNSFLARFFVNRGQTDNRWELKPHALGPFYRDLSDWSIFLTNPATYGWKDNTANIPPIHVHIHDVPLTEAQRMAVMDRTGAMFVSEMGGIATRGMLGQLAKGNDRGTSIDTAKPTFIRRLVESWPDESTIVWCIYNDEQDKIAAQFPEAANITGDTPYDERMRLIDDFKAGRRRVMISKGKILGFGLNLQICTRMVFSGLQDSYETYYQCVKRANRYGSTRPLNVHIPVTELERPMIETVLSKAKRVQQDAEEQERIFRNASQV